MFVTIPYNVQPSAVPELVQVFQRGLSGGARPMLQSCGPLPQKNF